MNRLPPEPGPPEDADELYRRASRREESAPSEATRRAVLEYAQQLTHERLPAAAVAARQRPPASGSVRLLKFGGLAAAALAAVLFAPRLLQRASPPAPIAAPGVAASSTAPALTGAPPAIAPPPALAQPESGTASADAARVEHALLDGQAQAARARQSDAASSPRAFQSDPRLLGPAAARGDVPALAAALDAGAPIEARDAHGRSALMRAVLDGRVNAAELLLRRGADPNAPDAQGQRPLQAARALHDGALEALLERYGAH